MPGMGIRRRGYAAPTAVLPLAPADFTVTSDVELSSLLSTQGAAGLANKIVAMSGTFTAPNFNIAPASTTTFRNVNDNAPAVLVRMKLNGSANLRFERLKIVTDNWTDNGGANNAFAALVYNSGSFGAHTFWNCNIRGGYGGPGSVGLVYNNDYNPTTTYPEYACILPTFSSGAIAFAVATAPNNNVAGLMADGTGYTWTVNTNTSTNGNVTWSVPAAGTFDVVGGLITNVIVTTPGASNAGSNPGLATQTKTIIWTAQRPFTNVSASGVVASGGITFTGRQLFYGCTITDLRDGIKFGVGAPGFIDIQWCNFSRIYQDMISIFVPSGSSAAGYTITDNYGTLPLCRSGDPFDPHGDFIQFFTGPSINSNWPNVTIERNIFVNGNSRGSMQGIFMESNDGSRRYNNLRIVGNFILSKMMTNQLALPNTDGAYVYRNTFVRMVPDDPDNALYTSMARFNSLTTGIGNTYIAKNFAETYSFSGVYTENGNVSITPNSNADYNAKFLSPPTFAGGVGSWPDTKAEALAAFAPEAGFVGVGAGGSDGYLDYTNGTTNLTMEPPYVALPDIINQVPSSNVSSSWVQILGGPSTGSISITGGTYQFADDAAGTNATVATAVSGTYTRGKFIRVNLTNSPSGLTQTLASVTLTGAGAAGGFTYSFRSSTYSTFARPVIALESSVPDLFRVSGASTMAAADGYTGTIVLWGVKCNGIPTSQTRIFDVSSGSATVLIALETTTGKLRVSLRGPTATTIVQVFSLGNICDNVARDFFISFDTSDTAVGTGLHFYVNETRTTSGHSWVASPSLIGYTRSMTSYQFGPTAAAQNNYEIAGLYINTTQRVDFTNSANRLAFTLDPLAMGLDGSLPTGQQPAYFFVGRAADYNVVGGINRGSRNKFVKFGSAAAADVSGSAWA